jgi:hypothetical protein
MGSGRPNKRLPGSPLAETFREINEKDVARQEHYMQFCIQPIRYLKNLLTMEAFEGYLVGNIIKYVARYPEKNGVEDLKKARTYLDWLIELHEKGDITIPGEEQT